MPILAAIAFFLAAVPAPPPSNMDLSMRLLETDGTQFQALSEVLSRSQELGPNTLADATTVARSFPSFDDARIEDAAFLYYAADIRWAYENVLFPPTDTFNPALYKMARETNHELIAIPLAARANVLSKVIARLEKWQPALTDSYRPDWPSETKGDLLAARAAASAQRAAYIDLLRGYSTLAQDPVYLATAEQLSKGLEKHKTIFFDERYEYLDTLKKIETEKGIKGIGTQFSSDP